MSEVPKFNIVLGGRDFEARPDNATLFTFLGQTAINGVLMDNARFNHVFFRYQDEGEGETYGSYVHRTERTEEVFDQIVQTMAELNFPMVINHWEVPQCDIDAYFRCLDQLAEAETADDFFPSEWEHGTQES